MFETFSCSVRGLIMINTHSATPTITRLARWIVGHLAAVSLGLVLIYPETVSAETSNIVHSSFKHGKPRVTIAGPCTGGQYDWLTLSEPSAWTFVQAGVSPGSATPTGWSATMASATKLAGMIGSAAGAGAAAKVAVKVTGLSITPTYIWWFQYKRTVISRKITIKCIDGKWVALPPVITTKTQLDWFPLSGLPVVIASAADLSKAKTRIEKSLAAAGTPQHYHTGP